MPYLTKSRFKTALECVGKLYYNDHREYANTALENVFLAELAKGGFQVGALAQCYYPGGVLIGKMDHEQAFQQTMDLLQQENAIIYEAAFLFENCFIRADIVEKTGKTIKLIEVKAKSYSPNNDRFFNSKGELQSSWHSYLFDIAFQTWVTEKSLEVSGLESMLVEPYLLLANKEATATLDGLNQQFFYDRNTRSVQVSDLAMNHPQELGQKILVEVGTRQEVRYIREQTYDVGSFGEMVAYFSEAVKNDVKLPVALGKKCKFCEYRNKNTSADLLDGFQECWTQTAGFTMADFGKPMVWDIWDFKKADGFVRAGQYFAATLTRADFEAKNGSKPAEKGMSRVDRQEMQVIKYLQNDSIPHVMVDELRIEMNSWVYPLHMIDFETTTVALPFYAGMRPYEVAAFQFSHHTIHADGRIEHADEWINTEQGKFPNFHFIRALKKALEKDSGTIFRYATHENTVLNKIHDQLGFSNEQDATELQSFIESITHRKNEKGRVQYGSRDMVDLCDTIRKFYYNPHTNGSNSIKAVLPAILNSSKYLQNKYSQPVYGTSVLPSKNFANHVWVKLDNGKVIDPYKLLEPVFSEHDDHILDEILSDEQSDIQNGGAAMAAYGMMQFTDMQTAEREAITRSLLRYCELDTMAMVMIWEELNQLG